MPLRQRDKGMLEKKITLEEIDEALKEGDGSLVDADKLDGKHATDFEPKDCGIGMVPEGKQVTKIGFWEDSNGNVKYIKFFDGAEQLFVLTFSDAGSAPSETWNIQRS